MKRVISNSHGRHVREFKFIGFCHDQFIRHHATKTTGIQANGDLPLEQKQQLKARYYMNSVKQRLIDTALPHP